MAACGVSLSRSSDCPVSQGEHKKPLRCCFTFLLAVSLCVFVPCHVTPADLVIMLGDGELSISSSPCWVKSMQ